MYAQKIISFADRYRLVVLILVDSVIVLVSLLLSHNLTDKEPDVGVLIRNWIALSVVYACTAWMSGLYRASTRHAGIYVLKKSLLSAFAVTVVVFFVMKIDGITYDRSFFALFFMFTVAGSAGARFWARQELFIRRQYYAESTLVYGAGAAGLEFLSSSLQGDSFNVVGLVDDDRALVGSNFHGRDVYDVERIPELIKQHNIRIIVLALPRIESLSRTRILEDLMTYQVKILSVPPLQMLLSGAAKVVDAQDVPIEDLLGREPILPIPDLIRGPIEGKVVFISGAGGSIGSELARQVAQYGPKKLILFEFSEPALFAIEQELKGKFGFSLALVPVLGSVADFRAVDDLFAAHSVDTVYHAAAYKHVPLVEENPFVALVNNVTGTKNVLNCAVEHKSSSFTLVSTDKAVRPTSIMGATKRLAELVCQAKAESEENTKISMVRFGNVLGSSGSVIPTFKKQIRMGGPVTVTHPEMTRYFMTIPEAAQLVLQASHMAEGGDVFLLDMGDSVKIAYLAERLIRMSGRILSTSSTDPAPGEICIEYTGLRPGEKLFEELLIDADSFDTMHPRIKKAKEFHLKVSELEPVLERLYVASDRRDLDLFKKLLRESSIGYSQNQAKVLKSI
ncbi:polysaccharide biosynthesis protein [Pseudomonadales bacterium]|nr:polysaccharide biosynthesis protein [Pseudomonadales bacterium]